MNGKLIHKMLIGSMLAYEMEAHIIKEMAGSKKESYILLNQDELHRVRTDFERDEFLEEIRTEAKDYGLKLDAAYYDIDTGGSGLSFTCGNEVLICYSGTNKADLAPFNWELLFSEDDDRVASAIIDNKDVLNDIYYMALQGKNIQVPSALVFFDSVIGRHRDKHVFVGGHSLGGGLALTVGTRRYRMIEKILAFNPAAIGKEDIKSDSIEEAETIIFALEDKKKYRIYRTQLDFLTSAPILKISDVNMFYPIETKDFIVIGDGAHSSLKQIAYISEFKKKYLDEVNEASLWTQLMGVDLSQAVDRFIEIVKSNVKKS